MALLTFTGFTLLGTAISAGAYQLGKGRRNLRRLLDEVFEIANIETKRGDVQTGVQVHRPHIYKLKKRHYGYDVVVQLPKGYAVEKFRDRLNIIEEATASKILMKYLRGRTVQLQMGMLPLYEKMDYSPDLAKAGTPSIPYYTPFGLKYLNLWDETTCHIIVAGATRMGKSVFLRLLFTNIMLAMNGNVQFFYVNNKKEDYYPMIGIPQIPEPAETLDEAHSMLNDVFREISERKKKLRAARDSVNIKQYRQKHPNDPVPPMFVVFDEYGRFAEDEEFQARVQEIAETAGYLDVHLVIATQRPDASTVLKPRIRANILTRVCFQTADSKNSELVVHTGAASQLDNVRGRAVILDGMPELGHVPYVSEEMTMELLKQFRKEESDAESTRQVDNDASEPLPGIEPRPHRGDDVPERGETVRHGESNHEATKQGRSHHNRTTPKRRVLPLHAEPGPYPHRVK